MSSDAGSDASSDSDVASTSASSVTMDASAFTTNAFSSLTSDNGRKVLDIVDQLRRSGLNGTIELPQLVVCGDQSSGKSSVLEAITEIPFPRNEGLCTRFATEIILRRSSESTIEIKITPDKHSSEDEQKRLREFKISISDFSELPGVIEAATEFMGLGGIDEPGAKQFSRHVLSMEICGPDRPQLTLVDLPGLIHVSQSNDDGEDEKALIFGLVKEYMTNPRTIILAVVSGRNDWSNQSVLELRKKMDSAGRRTLGIITKPDAIAQRDIHNWIDLAQNKRIYLERGWHMLRNRDPDEMDFTFQQRNDAEIEFFSQGKFADLSRQRVGISALRDRLSSVLLSHLLSELPSVKDEIHAKLHKTNDDLEQMGEARNTISEQRASLTRIAMKIHGLLKAAITGYYADTFFGQLDMEAAVDSDENIRRFRAVVQHLNIQFAAAMRRQGHKYAMGNGPGDDDAEVAEETQASEELASLGDQGLGAMLPKPKALTRKESVQWVRTVLERSRGYELPGNFNPMLISQLFWEQSSPWDRIAAEHINLIHQVCKDFVYKVIEHAAPPEFLARLASQSVDTALEGALKSCRDELKRVIADKKRHPMTYNHYFTTTIQKQRQRKHSRIAQNAKDQSSTNYNNHYHRYDIDPVKFEQAFAKAIEQNMDKYSAEEALDNQRAYYKDELSYFINVVAKQVIERHLVEPLPDIILSPSIINDMTDDEIGFVASEPRETTEKRNYLEQRKAMLEKGLETFREAMGGLKR